MDDDCRNHTKAELMTDCERIELLEHSVGVLQDRVEALEAALHRPASAHDAAWLDKAMRLTGAVVDEDGTE